MPLSDAQRMFLLIGNMHPHGIMPYRPEEHPTATELNALGCIEYGSVEHKRLMSADECSKVGWPAKSQMCNVESFGYFITESGRAALRDK